MMTIKIDKGIPIPQSRKLYELPLDKLEVGDSFFYPAALPKKRRRVQCVMHEAARRLGIKCRTRKERLDGADGIRCWRYA